ncbi:MAG: YihY/virulence factor BrkB family protein, partial [Acetobacteraceae bacterium]|nr:YihY/virulence factor BrkB family protein [Acetobacteraceae bacterium]
MSKMPDSDPAVVAAVENAVTGIEAMALVNAPDAHILGRDADAPLAMPWRGWWAAFRRAFWQMLSDRMSLVSAGCAFYATLALFPAISMLVFLYGLIFDPVTVAPQLRQLRDLVPPAVFDLIDARVLDLVGRPAGSLGIGLAISTSIALWSSTTGTKAMLLALNVAYDEDEHRSIITFQLTALAMTMCATLAAVLTLAALVVVPILVSFIGLSSYSKILIHMIGLLMLAATVLVSLAMLYRFGPSRRRAQLRWVTPGSIIATILWLGASALFSFYVGRFAGYDATYGPLAAAIGVMMWFWVTAYIVLFGAQLNSQLELQTA